MALLSLFLLFSVFWVAYANGANDNFKGVATLHGSGTTDYEKSLIWATGTTFFGSVAALFIGGALVKAFSGSGLVPDSMLHEPVFALSLCVGSAGTILLATRLGFPISTTHALTGALVGAGLMGPAGALNYARLWNKFLFPLLLSPVLAIAATWAVYRLFRRARLALGITKETCVCVGDELVAVTAETSCKTAMGAVAESVPALSVGREADCVERYNGRLMGVSAQEALDFAHYISAGAVSFARGLNDTPKIVGLLIMAKLAGISSGMALVGFAIAAGGLLSAKRVARTMSHDIVDMNHGQGFTANLMTSVLVIGTSVIGAPVSTTHVSCGALFGIGAATGEAKVKTIGRIILAWIITLPMAALLAAAVYLIAGT